MTSHDDVPYADTESLSDLIEECRCVEQECASHGVGLHVAHHHGTAAAPGPIVIGDVTRHAVDGYPEYGS